MQSSDPSSIEPTETPSTGSVHLLNDYLENRKIRMANNKTPGFIGVSTGNAVLDQGLGGHYGTTIVGGASGVGKSSYVLQTCIAAMLADPTVGVAYMNYEATSSFEILDQLHCMVAAVDLKNYAAGKISEDELARIKAARLLLGRILPRMTIHTFNEHRRIEDGWIDWIYAWHGIINPLITEAGMKRIITVVDRLQRMPYPRITANTDPKDKAMLRDIAADPDAWRMTKILDADREIGGRNGHAWPFFIISEVRKIDDRKRELELIDVLGSVGNIYDADRVLLLIASGKAVGVVAPTLLKVAKARRGDLLRLNLSFHFRQFRFAEITLPGAPLIAPSPKQLNTTPNPQKDIKYAGR